MEIGSIVGQSQNAKAFRSFRLPHTPRRIILLWIRCLCDVALKKYEHYYLYYLLVLCFIYVDNSVHILYFVSFVLYSSPMKIYYILILAVY